MPPVPGHNDRHHIISHANKALTDVRVEEARELGRQGRRDLAGSSHAILHGAENAPARHEPGLAQLKAGDLRTAKGYALKQVDRFLRDEVEPALTAYAGKLGGSSQLAI